MQPAEPFPSQIALAGSVLKATPRLKPSAQFCYSDQFHCLTFSSSGARNALWCSDPRKPERVKARASMGRGAGLRFRSIFVMLA